MATELRVEDPDERTSAATSRLDQWRTHLLQIAAGSFKDVIETGFLGRELRAAAVISAMAELEAMLREMLISIGHHVNVARLPVSELKPSLRPLAVHGAFESLQQLRRSEEMWLKRTVITNLDTSPQIAVLPSRTLKAPQPPLDGRTIQPRHLSTVRDLLGFQNFEVPARTSGALIKLTQIRNDVAHANTPIVEVFSQAGRRATDIAGYLLEVKTLVELLGQQWSAYLSREEYKLSGEGISSARGSRHHMSFT